MAKAVALDGIVEVATAFSGPSGSFPVGALYRADDPLVKKYPQFFRPAVIRTTVKRAAERPIEQATAAPGEKRGD